jgi:hypothetical protein
VDETHFLEELARAARFAFLIGVRSSGRKADHTSDTELNTIGAWVTETLRHYLLLDDVMSGRTVLILDGNEVRGRKPTEAERKELREWLRSGG